MEAEKKVLRQNAEALTKRKEYLFAELSRICDITKKGVGEVDADVYLRTIGRLENSFEKITEEILTLNCQLDRESQIPTKDFSTIQTLIEGIVKHCVKARAKGVASRSQPAINAEEEAALPRLSLPIWEGDVATWSDFKAQFDSAVGRRSNLSGVAKLQYLHASLRGEPLSIVTQYTLSNESYDLAYRDLVLRYENKRRLASHHLSKILNFKSQCAPSGREHIKYMEVHRAALSALKQLKLEDLADFVLFELCYKNLSRRDQKEFDLDHDHNQVPSTRDIFTYVEKIARSEELRMDNEPSLPNETNFKQKKKSNAIKGSLMASIKQKPSCFNCSGDHMLYCCPSLLTLPVNERKMKVLELGCCVACLYKHPKRACKSKFSCKTCGSRAHNTVLHSEDPPVEVRKDQSDSASTSQNSCNCVSLQSKKTCVLGTLLCQVQDVWGNGIPVRALLDPGSEISIITSHLVKRLGFSKSTSTCRVEGIGPTLSQTLGNVRLTISSNHSPQTSYALEAAVLPKICSLPKTNISNAVLDRFRSIELADPNFCEPGRIDLLLGVEVYSDILSTQEPVIIAGNPSAVRTTFGYVISGRVEAPEQTAASALSLCLTKSSLETAITRFWEAEEISRDVPADPADVLCEQHFLRTHEREPSGRFVVRLPFIPDLPPLGDNEEIALKRLRNLERRLAKNPSFAKSYEECINEYIRLNHISIASEKKANYLLPHHAVFKESSTTTKCRVVFDCSSPDDNGLSLNNRWYRGPPLLHDISLLLINFRMFKVCFAADIKVMYRMVSVHPDDRHQLISLLAKGCFEVRRWSSSVPEALSEVPENFRDTPVKLPSGENGVKIHEGSHKLMLFGIACTQVTDPIAKASKHWRLTQLSYADTHPMFTNDNFPNFFRIVPSENAFNPPRLKLLQEFNWTRVGTIYQNKPRYSLAHNRLVADLDILGFHVVETQSFANEVSSALSKLKEKDVQIILGNFNESWAREIFCEAFKFGMYGRKYQWLIMGTYSTDWWVDSSELQCCCWHEIIIRHDSTIVLAWLERPLHELKIFISNRVAEIKLTVPRAIWGYVPGQENPADLGSRGVSATDLKDAKSWWYGPNFLTTDYQDWPNGPPSSSIVGQLKELQKLSPFFETRARLIRVGGRLSRASFLSEDAKHPFLIPKRSHLAVPVLALGKSVGSVHESYRRDCSRGKSTCARSGFGSSSQNS